MGYQNDVSQNMYASNFNDIFVLHLNDMFVSNFNDLSEYEADVEQYVVFLICNSSGCIDSTCMWNWLLLIYKIVKLTMCKT
jgi:hypothetical protein